MKPVPLKATFHEKIWGSPALGPWFPQADRKIGEVWFTAPEPLPILVKFLFTSDKLSVQVHPGGAAGKTEMWHILRAEPGASIALGLRRPATRECVRNAALSGKIEAMLNWMPVRAGETYFVPAGTIHALGGGLALCEIQQNRDVTYRLYDYGRPRELHLEQALAVAHLASHPGAARPGLIGPGCERLAHCSYFCTECLSVDRSERYQPGRRRFELLVALEGRGRIGASPLKPGEVWLVPAGCPPFLLEPESPLRLLRTYVPDEER